jgi:DNA repair ATPase RecN
MSKHADELDELEARISELEAELDCREAEVVELQETISDLESERISAEEEAHRADYFADVPPTDTELYNQVWRPLYDAWRISTGDAYQPDLQELADFYIDRLHELEELNAEIERKADEAEE